MSMGSQEAVALALAVLAREIPGVSSLASLDELRSALNGTSPQQHDQRLGVSIPPPERRTSSAQLDRCSQCGCLQSLDVTPTANLCANCGAIWRAEEAGGVVAPPAQNSHWPPTSNYPNYPNSPGLSSSPTKHKQVLCLGASESFASKGGRTRAEGAQSNSDSNNDRGLWGPVFDRSRSQDLQGTEEEDAVTRAYRTFSRQLRRKALIAWRHPDIWFGV